MSKPSIWQCPARYNIKVSGRLDNHWSDWFESMSVTSETGVTTIDGVVADQAALHALLIRIRDLGLPLISVNRVENKQRKMPQNCKKRRKNNIRRRNRE